MRRPLPMRPLTMILLIVIAVQSIMNNEYGSIREWLIQTLLALPAIIIAISFHEFAHAKVAELSGDDIPRRQGRVTLNPAAHIDPVGLFCLIFLGFGWGRPVEINAENFKRKRLDLLLVSLAGVTLNFLLAFLFCGIWVTLSIHTTVFMSEIGSLLSTVFMNLLVYNIVLCVFNLLPIPPLDGFNVVTEIFNLRQTKIYHYAHVYGYLILVALVALNVTDLIISPAIGWLVNTMINVFL